MAFSYEKQPFIDVDHTHGAAVQDYAHKILLNANNFDFSQVRADLFDVQFADEVGNVLPHYLYHYDASRGQAVLFVKMNLQAGQRKPVTLRWGDPAAGVDPSDASVCVYANRLATVADLAEFDSSFGSLSTAIVTDVNAPLGSAVEFSGGTSDSGLLKVVDLPETYEAWVMDAMTSATAGAYGGTLTEASDGSNYHRLGRGHNGTVAIIKNLVAGVGEWTYSNSSTDEHPPLGEYVMQQTLVGPAHKFVQIDSIPVVGNAQGLSYHGDVGFIYSTSFDISRIALDGTVEETLSPTVGGTSFGGCQIVDLNDGQGLQCYIVLYDSSFQTSEIYRCDPKDLASGITLVADVMVSMPAGYSIGAITYDPIRKRWLISTAQTAYSRCDFFEFSKDFSIAYGRIDCNESDWGFNGMEYSKGMVFGTEHSAAKHNSNALSATWWQGYAVDESARYGHASHALYPLSDDGQGIAYNQADDLWYVLDRNQTPDAIRVMRLEVDRTQRHVTGRWGYNEKVVGSNAMVDQSPAPQTQVGIGAYRAMRFANLAYIKTTFPLPVNRLSAASNSAVFPTPSEVVSVADTQHVVSV